MKPCEDTFDFDDGCGAPGDEHFIIVDMHSIWLCPRHAEDWRDEDLLFEGDDDDD